MAAALKIAVIGAGPVGCTLARILHLSGVSVTIYESDSSPNYRSQGGTLDLHPDTGLAALKEAKLFDHFLQKARLQGDFYSMTDRHGKPYIQFGGSKGGPEGGVLRRELPHWLNLPALRPLVLGAVHPQGANSGAVHLLLRRRRDAGR